MNKNILFVITQPDNEMIPPKPEGFDTLDTGIILVFIHNKQSLTDLLLAFRKEHHEYVTWKFNKIQYDLEHWRDTLR